MQRFGGERGHNMFKERKLLRGKRIVRYLTGETGSRQTMGSLGPREPPMGYQCPLLRASLPFPLTSTQIKGCLASFSPFTYSDISST